MKSKSKFVVIAAWVVLLLVLSIFIIKYAAVKDLLPLLIVLVIATSLLTGIFLRGNRKL